MILVDTSIWVDHLRRGEPNLDTLLNRNEVLVHPLVIGELACGNLKDRKTVLDLFRPMPAASEAGHDEVLFMIERHQLMGRGIGYVDAHLVAAALIDGAGLWTRDRRLAAVIGELGLG